MSSSALSASAISTTLAPQQRPRLSRKSKSDPFFNLPAASSAVPSPPEHHGSRNRPIAPQYQDVEDDSSYSFIYSAIMTPILFISFLLSLFLVNRSDLARRATNSPGATSRASSSYFSPRAWLSPDPYRDRRHSAPPPNRRDTLVDGGDSSAGKKHVDSAGLQPSQNWFYRKKHRAMAKLAISDAFDQRGRIIAGMVTVMILCLGVSTWSLRVAYMYWIA